ncbi:LamG domain-containing protein [Polyangium fumosum]|uniref:Uncharacterized protein n=1 Tax=Polyangium fumosum TaxID=889272 RepID=A0A4U1IL33_9BACT|nr:LamG domain-containing protein [Polyangium fumosum]TKC94711.1 hypothetical protein E8A74_47830 [Polyangium fumosum]
MVEVGWKITRGPVPASGPTTSNLVARYNASNLTTIGTKVAVWDDLVGAHDLTLLGLPINAPIVDTSGTFPFVHFAQANPASPVVQILSHASLTLGACTLIAAFRPTAHYDRFVWCHGDAPQANPGAGLRTRSMIVEYSRDPGSGLQVIQRVGRTLPTAVDAQPWLIVAFVSDGTTNGTFVTVNGAFLPTRVSAPPALPPGSASVPTSFNVGGRGDQDAAFHFEGDIHEILVYNAVLSHTDLALNTTYLKNVLGL